MRKLKAGAPSLTPQLHIYILSPYASLMRDAGLKPSKKSGQPALPGCESDGLDRHHRAARTKVDAKMRYRRHAQWTSWNSVPSGQASSSLPGYSSTSWSSCFPKSPCTPRDKTRRKLGTVAINSPPGSCVVKLTRTPPCPFAITCVWSVLGLRGLSIIDY